MRSRTSSNIPAHGIPSNGSPCAAELRMSARLRFCAPIRCSGAPGVHSNFRGTRTTCPRPIKKCISMAPSRHRTGYPNCVWTSVSSGTTAGGCSLPARSESCPGWTGTPRKPKTAEPLRPLITPSLFNHGANGIGPSHSQRPNARSSNCLAERGDGGVKAISCIAFASAGPGVANEKARNHSERA